MPSATAPRPSPMPPADSTRACRITIRRTKAAPASSFTNTRAKRFGTPSCASGAVLPMRSTGSGCNAAPWPAIFRGPPPSRVTRKSTRARSAGPEGSRRPASGVLHTLARLHLEHEFQRRGGVRLDHIGHEFHLAALVLAHAALPLILIIHP